MSHHARGINEARRIARVPWVIHPELPDSFDCKWLRPGRTGTALRPAQRLGLYWLGQVGGLLGAIGVGHGKGLLSMLAPNAVNARRPMLLLPASMIPTFQRELAKFGAMGWLVRTDLMLISYEQLSRQNAVQMLASLNPDFIFADECHKIADLTSTRTGRFCRYMDANPRVLFAAVSGTLVKRKLKDFAHLAGYALRNAGSVHPDAGSILPREYMPLERLGACIDTQRGRWDEIIKDRAAPAFIQPIMDAAEAHGNSLSCPKTGALGTFKQRARRAWAHRFGHAPGVVATASASVDASLHVHGIDLPPPFEVQKALDLLKEAQIRPDGEEVDDPMRAALIREQLLAGGYTRWLWPNGVADDEWLKLRASWHRECRKIIATRDVFHDSAALVAQGLTHGRIDNPQALSALTEWQRVRSRWAPHPPVEWVWLSKYKIEYAKAWAREGGVIFYSQQAVGDALEAAGIETWRAGTEPETSKRKAIACSIKAHGTGKNLQRHRRELVISWLLDMEQVIGRIHRQGQLSDLCEVHGFLSDAVPMARSIQAAHGVETMNHTTQKLSSQATFSPELQIALDEARKQERER